MFKYLLIDNLCLEFHGRFRFIICGTGTYFGLPRKHVCLIFVDSLVTAEKSLTGINLHKCWTVNCCCWCWLAFTSKLNLIHEKSSKLINVVKNVEKGKFNFSSNSLTSYNLQFISGSYSTGERWTFLVNPKSFAFFLSTFLSILGCR